MIINMEFEKEKNVNFIMQKFSKNQTINMKLLLRI